MSKKELSNINREDSSAKKIALLFIILIFIFLIFILRVIYISNTDRKLPATEISKEDSAIRGTIKSLDGFDLTVSKKLYKAIVYPKNISKDKRELFINLFSIYSGEPVEKIEKKLDDSKFMVVLSYRIDEKRAKRLRELKYKLTSRKVFVEFEDESGRVINYGLDIIESGEKRIYLYEDAITPVVGYIKKIEDGTFTDIDGVKGVEKSYNEKLKPIQDEYIKGYRDIGSNIILNAEHSFKERIDGLNIHLSIPLKLQSTIEKILDNKKIEYQAKEIIASIMMPDGEILTLATSNRFNPNRILTKDYPSLNANAIEYAFEPGSVMKPILFAILLQRDLIDLDEVIDTENGYYKLKDRVITDDHPAKEMSMIDLIVHSSNIGMSKIAQRLDAQTYYESLLEFGFNQESGIDLPYESRGSIPNINTLRNEVYKATISYGYGLGTTFIQILRAYNSFINSGELVTPLVANYLSFKDRYQQIPRPEKKRVISKEIAKQIEQILIENVERGTGRRTQVDNIVVGGKTGTAHIAKEGIYADAYNSSFFGFAKDSNHSYTIGVTVFEPKDRYFASQTAVPIFKEIVQTMINQGYLKKIKE